MKKTIERQFLFFLPLSSLRREKVLRFLLFSILLFLGASIFAQGNRTVKGLVVDENEDPVIGATIILKGTTIGAVTDINGEYAIEIPNSGNQVLVFSFIGLLSEEVDVTGKDELKVVLVPDLVQIGDVIVVGYGKQKKESVVGAISQTKAEVLERTGGINSLGAALTGNIPGLVTLQGTGKPGEEDPLIYIRGMGTWNHSQPLVLIDGIERSMSGIDINSVESISVLKDASATAVFGVKGANGVILITTKRGSTGKANITISSSATMKIPSKIPNKYDAYDALRIRNQAIERELGVQPGGWASYTPIAELDKYRNPSSIEEAERYPNVDWQEESFKDYAMSNNTNISIAGGSEFVKYFTSVDYLNEGDIMNVRENGKGYTPGYDYDRLNIRSNLDFLVTKSTTFAANLYGSYGQKQNTWSGFEYTMWQGVYGNPPDAFPIQYSDGAWGFYPNDPVGVVNSVSNFSNSGIRKENTTTVNTDFTLTQDLGMLLKGLKLKGIFSLDNKFVSEGGVRDNGGTYAKWISPEGEEILLNESGRNRYDYIIGPWSYDTYSMLTWQTYRKIFYQAQADYNTTIGKNEITAMGLFSQEQWARGNQFPTYREDWVFRTTYNYDTRYFIEINGSYNGSEKFSRDYRFDFFPSVALGWTISNESFMKNLIWLNRFKLRGSWGRVGNDMIVNIDDPNYETFRFNYMEDWNYGGQSLLGRTYADRSPYSWYTEGVIPNPDLRWETVEKKNLGIEYSFFNGLVEGSVDLFKDYRYDVLVRGTDRAVMDYLGGDPPSVNIGETVVKGYEIEAKLNKRFANSFRVWLNFAMTHAKDKVLEADDPALYPDYYKKEGYQIGQYRSIIISDFANTWDEVYATTQWNSNDVLKLPGDYNFIDFNGDGVINDYDNAPNGFPERPQNTYNTSFGIDYKGFSFFVQLYGVSNVTRYISFGNFPRQKNVVFDQGEFWSKDNQDAESFLPRFVAQTNMTGNYYAYDGSYLRLKNAELAYTFNAGLLSKINVSSLRIYLNGNNLLLWTKMPDDRESNLGGWGSQGTYPTVRRINLGVKIVL
ncbi:MAG: SusC/RagA family TonB-linked outer membrane protein [Bacteroidales bacterium]|nr:SusC/RagA family TonB-linked outer membrane protein [Bacteroidales bacterium]